MLTRGDTVPDGEVIDTQVCIVGAGIAGIAVAHHLMKAGLEVTIVERGGTPLEPPVETPTVTNVGLPYPFDDTRAFGIGGSINKWTVDTPLGGGMGRLRELDEEDFTARPWIPHSGWPIGKSVLDPWYGRARTMFGLEPATTSSLDARLETGLLPEGDRTLTTRVFSFANPAAFPGEYARALEAAPNTLVLIHSVGAAFAKGDEGSRVLEVTTGGPRFQIRARHFVLAAGAVETARLLLASREGEGPSLGNAHDLVGRYFMEHPHFSSGLITPGDQRLLDAVETHAIHHGVESLVQRTYGLPEPVVEREGLPRVTYILQPVPDSAQLSRLGYGDAAHRTLRQVSALRKADGAASKLRGLATVAGGAHHLVRYAKDRAADALGRALGSPRYTRPRHLKLYAMAEQIPDPLSRVVLTDDLDEFGVRRVALDWRLTPTDIDGYRRNQDLFGREAERAGLGRVRTLLRRTTILPGLVGGAHHMGTTRMSHDPRHGVVDPNCRLHEAADISVAGAAVFPTVGFANPALTTVAIALRLADHIRSSLSAPTA